MVLYCSKFQIYIKKHTMKMTLDLSNKALTASFMSIKHFYLCFSITKSVKFTCFHKKENIVFLTFNDYNLSCLFS